MGLDITAYENIREIEDNEPEYYFSGGWEQSNMEKIEDREVQVEFDNELDFRAGSYMGYGGFRKHLCQVVNKIEIEKLWEIKDISVKETPFYWLLNFSDCEGYIGTSYCEILFDNFKDFEQIFMEGTDKNSYFIEVYLNFKEAFEIAKNKGLVNFH